MGVFRNKPRKAELGVYQERISLVPKFAIERLAHFLGAGEQRREITELGATQCLRSPRVLCTLYLASNIR